MKKILHMTPPIINNGVYRYIFNHMQYIDQQRYQFSFLTKKPKGLYCTKEFEKYRFPVHELCNVERDNPNGLRDEIVRILKEGYDAVHLHTSYWRGFLIEQIAMEMGVPRVIVHSHSTGIDEADEKDRGELLKKHNAYKEKFSLAYATDVCACSKLAGQWLYGEQVPKEEIKILPNAIQVERFHFQPQIRKNKREKLGIDNRIVIGNIGRYCYQKNQKFLLKAFAEAYRYNPALFLLFLGEGELLEELKAFAEKQKIEKAIFFLPWQERVEDYLQVMDVFCLPSRFEGLPISVVEAQAAGLKCFVSNTVTSEVDLTGLVKFIPLEKECWIDAIVHTKEDRYRERLDDCFEIAGYSMEASCRRLLRLYCN